MTSTIIDQRLLDPTRVPFGLDSHGKWLNLRFTEIENPHILLIGGSQTGKTTLQILIAALAASRGNIVLVLDPKLRFSHVFQHPETGRPLANVLVFRDRRDLVAAQEWQGALELVVAEMQHRYQCDENERGRALKDQKRFPTILVVVDELGTLLDFADKEWPYRKPDNYKGKTPVRELIHTITRMGAEARVVGCFANQTASEQEMPAGTRTRTLCGQRMFLGPIREGTQWRMLAGERVSPPDIPDNQKGAGVVLYNDGLPIRFQGALLDWANHPERVYNLAAQGLPLLRESGYLDSHDRLILAGHPTPRPGVMASHVAEGFLDLLQLDTPGPQAKGQPADEDQVDEPVADEPVADEVPDTVNVIVGLQDAADFCGMTVANFRKIRDLHPIEGEISKYQGNKPGWQEPDLKVWAMRHAEHRTRRDDSRKVGA